jgi:hypothetical protein
VPLPDNLRADGTLCGFHSPYLMARQGVWWVPFSTDMMCLTAHCMAQKKVEAGFKPASTFRPLLQDCLFYEKHKVCR